MIINGRATKLCKRFNLQNHAHELTFSCYNRRPFLKSPRVCDWLAESIDRARTNHNFSLWAYVFMPTHVHLLIFPHNEQYSISEILKSIKMPVAIKAIAYLRSHNPSGLKQLETGQRYRSHRFWQRGGGYDRNVKEIDTLLNSAKYIHNNPVRKEMCEFAEQYSYSSAAQWAGMNSGSLRVDKDTWPPM